MALCLVAVIIVVALVASGGDDDDSSQSPPVTTAAPVTTVPPDTAAVDAVFQPIPGYTYDDAPEGIVDELGAGFRDAIGGQDIPGLNLEADELAQIGGRMVLEDGDEVAAALVMIFDPRIAALLDGDEYIQTLVEEDPTARATTVAGQPSISTSEDDSEVIGSYKNGTFIVVAGPEGSQTKVREIMTALLGNVR